MVTAMLFLVGCNAVTSPASKTPIVVTCTPAVTGTPIPTMAPSYDTLLEQLMKDTKVPLFAQSDFIKAVHGDGQMQESVQEWIDDSPAIHLFPTGNYKRTIPEAEVLFNIAQMYHYSEDQELAVDKKKALDWYALSSQKGYFESAIYAGDMLLAGDGVKKDEYKAFSFYQRALEIKPRNIAYSRIGDCYYNGYGTQKDRTLAYEYYLSSAFGGDSHGLSMLTKMQDSTIQKDLLLSMQKAAVSVDNDYDYFAMAYGEMGADASSKLRLELIKTLEKAWDSDTDTLAQKMRGFVKKDPYFPSDFIDRLMRTVYSYSYSTFVSEHVVKPNVAEKEKLVFAPTKGDGGFFEGYDGDFASSSYHSDFYRYDFDQDGKEELYTSVTSGAGGAFMGDGVTLFKQNKKGQYEYFSGNGDFSLRDNVCLIEYGGRYYFVANPYSDSQEAPYDIHAFCFDAKGKVHKAFIKASHYQLQDIADWKDEDYIDRHQLGELISKQSQKAKEAIAATKQNRLYSPKDEKRFKSPLPSPKTDASLSHDYFSNVQDLFWNADVNNDGKDEIVQKSHGIEEAKYYYDYNYFAVFHDKQEYDQKAMSIVHQDFSAYDYFGLISSGNLYDILPIADKMVQFWTGVDQKTTYCMEVSRDDMRYTFRVFVIENGKPHCIYQKLIFDLCDGIAVQFEKSGSAKGGLADMIGFS